MSDHFILNDFLKLRVTFFGKIKLNLGIFKDKKDK
ncbi:hypothetical protein CY0110_07694 [Crocosphaera chwakensis CCY0110]|uniref:Uncharacterized protein n=1 Tax=Crocosphaera chwakensis CCY0110 TaxID=391612 RepID=A3IP24_9CHRO|nr:hypothetical protein CY0110_07694 [Crocosphaera chwakensis CCY0110]